MSGKPDEPTLALHLLGIGAIPILDEHHGVEEVVDLLNQQTNNPRVIRDRIIALPLVTLFRVVLGPVWNVNLVNVIVIFPIINRNPLRVQRSVPVLVGLNPGYRMSYFAQFLSLLNRILSIFTHLYSTAFRIPHHRHNHFHPKTA